MPYAANLLPFPSHYCTINIQIMTPCIQIKRVYEAADPADGYRILVDRLWPRGVRKDALPYDLWPKDLTPSPALRRWFHEDPDGHWEEFSQRYRSELATAPSVDEVISRIRPYDTVTLLSAAKATDHNHALILRDFLTQRMG